MKTTALNREMTQEPLALLPPVTVLADHKERRIDGLLNCVVHVKGRANILMRELFSPLCSAAVVIRGKDGSYVDPCDFGSYLRQKRNGRRESPQSISSSQPADKERKMA